METVGAKFLASEEFFFWISSINLGFSKEWLCYVCFFLIRNGFHGLSKFFYTLKNSYKNKIIYIEIIKLWVPWLINRHNLGRGMPDIWHPENIFWFFCLFYYIRKIYIVDIIFSKYFLFITLHNKPTWVDLWEAI